MAKHGRKYKEKAALVVPGRLHGLEDGVELLKKLHYVKFNESVDVAVKLGVDPKHADQMVRGAVALPHGIGKEVRVIVFAKGDKVAEARDAGADVAGGDELVQQIQGGWMDFDKVIATPDMMGSVGKIGRILGPRGLMPNPKTGTVTFDIARTVKAMKGGKIDFRVDKAGIVHAPIGRMGFEPNQLAENLKTLVDTLVRLKPAAAKGTYVQSITVSGTMTPPVAFDPSTLTRTTAV